MKKKIDFTTLITTLICLLPMILSAAIYKQLPEQVAIHFDDAGNPNGYASRAVAAFGLPIFIAALNLFNNFILNNDPKKANLSYTMKQLAKWLVPILSVIIVPITLFIAIGINIPINIIVPAFVGVIIIACGNYLPKSKQNYTIGIKLPWTLNSEKNWNKTHRLAGYIWIIGGIIMVISSFLKEAIIQINLVVIIALVVIPFIYSYILYKKGV